MTRRHLPAAGAILLLALLALGGCGAYTLQGRVVDSSFSTMTYVEADDQRITGEKGVAGVEVTVFRDPDKPNRTRVGRGVTGPDGSFTIPLDSFGAGFLIEDFEVIAQRGGYQPARVSSALPDKKFRLLIMLAPGRSVPVQEQENLMDVYEKYK